MRKRGPNGWCGPKPQETTIPESVRGQPEVGMNGRLQPMLAVRDRRCADELAVFSMVRQGGLL